MCVVSAISNYYSPSYLTIPTPREWDEDTKKLMREVIKRLDEIDKRLNDKECMDDKKQEFFEAIGMPDGGTTI